MDLLGIWGETFARVLFQKRGVADNMADNIMVFIGPGGFKDKYILELIFYRSTV